MNDKPHSDVPEATSPNRPSSTNEVVPTSQESSGTDNNKKSGFLSRHLKKLPESAKEVLILVAIVGTCFGVKMWQERYIDDTVLKKLSDKTILRQIAEESRPSLIFTSDESVVEDFGAAHLIANNGKEIHLTKENDGWPKHITIDFIKALDKRPILTSMDENVVILAKHGKGFSWEFEIREQIQHGGVITNLWSYRLEVGP